MISEKWDVHFNVQQLKEHFYREVIDKEITRQSSAFGGWSILSSNGDYRDGWHGGHKLLDPQISEVEKQELKKNLSKKSFSFSKETAICTGYLKEVIDMVRDYKLQPRRARIISLKAGTSCVWHRDTEEKIYAVRLHVPIITNPACFFETRTEREHLAADGSAYFIYVNREHRVVNNGTEDRMHLVMDITDEHQVTKYHRIQDFNPDNKINS